MSAFLVPREARMKAMLESAKKLVEKHESFKPIHKQKSTSKISDVVSGEEESPSRPVSLSSSSISAVSSISKNSNGKINGMQFRNVRDTSELESIIVPEAGEENDDEYSPDFASEGSTNNDDVTLKEGKTQTHSSHNVSSLKTIPSEKTNNSQKPFRTVADKKLLNSNSSSSRIMKQTYFDGGKDDQSLSKLKNMEASSLSLATIRTEKESSATHVSNTHQVEDQTQDNLITTHTQNSEPTKQSSELEFQHSSLVIPKKEKASRKTKEKRRLKAEKEQRTSDWVESISESLVSENENVDEVVVEESPEPEGLTRNLKPTKNLEVKAVNDRGDYCGTLEMSEELRTSKLYAAKVNRNRRKLKKSVKKISTDDTSASEDLPEDNKSSNRARQSQSESKKQHQGDKIEIRKKSISETHHYYYQRQDKAKLEQTIIDKEVTSILSSYSAIPNVTPKFSHRQKTAVPVPVDLTAAKFSEETKQKFRPKTALELNQKEKYGLVEHAIAANGEMFVAAIKTMKELEKICRKEKEKVSKEKEKLKKKAHRFSSPRNNIRPSIFIENFLMN